MSTNRVKGWVRKDDCIRSRREKEDIDGLWFGRVFRGRWSKPQLKIKRTEENPTVIRTVTWYHRNDGV